MTPKCNEIETQHDDDNHFHDDHGKVRLSCEFLIIVYGRATFVMRFISLSFPYAPAAE